jgi:hypothetical protein
MAAFPHSQLDLNFRVGKPGGKILPVKKTAKPLAP